MQTLGFLIDKLQVVNLKMWNVQKSLYKIRHMTKEQFMKKYTKPAELEKLYGFIKGLCDLNVQRANVTDEIDEFLVKVVEMIEEKKVDKTQLLQRKHKAY